MVPTQTRLGRQPHPTFTGANRHHKKYKVNKPKLSSLSLPGPQNQQRRRKHLRRTRNRKCVWGIGYSGTTTEDAALRWQALWIGNHDRGVRIGRWAKGLDDNNGCVNWGIRTYNTSEWTSPTAEAPVCLWSSWGLDDYNRGINWGRRRYNAYEWTSPTAEAPVCLRDQGIDDNNGGVDRVRWAGGLSDNNGGVDRGRVICNVSEVLEITMEEAGARQPYQGIYNNNGGVRGRKWAQRPCLFSIQSLSRFDIFHHIPFPPLAAWNTISNAIMRKTFLLQVYTNLAYVPPL